MLQPSRTEWLTLECKKWRGAVGLSVLINLGLIGGLANLAQGGLATKESSRKIPVTVRTPPPPPPPPPPPAESTPKRTAAIPTPSSPLPPLELPPMASAGGGIPIPQVDGSSFDWAFSYQLPTYGARDLAAESKEEIRVEPAELLYHPNLERHYPAAAKRLRLTGNTVVRIKIDAAGRVVNVQILSSDPPGVFDQAARRAAKELSYRPATKNGRPMASTRKMELRWELAN